MYSIGILPIFYYNFVWSIIYKNIKSLCCTAETNISQIYFNLKKKKKKRTTKQTKEPKNEIKQLRRKLTKTLNHKTKPMQSAN